jgi:formamidopyrimidine-DNA glycosylase
MPELPEVETVKRGLQRLLPKLVFAEADSDNLKSFPNAKSDVGAFLISSHVVGVSRRAKVLLIELSSGYSLMIHLKMTGQLVFVGAAVVDSNNGLKSQVRFGAGHPNESLVGRLPDKSTRVSFSFTNGSHLYFNDQRKFGWVRLLPTTELVNLDFFKKVGPEPLSDDFTVGMFRERLNRRKNSMIKPVLLDQTVVAGIGNIYADESLWGAKIHPETIVRDVPAKKIAALYVAMRSVLQLSIDKGGSTDHTSLQGVL